MLEYPTIRLSVSGKEIINLSSTPVEVYVPKKVQSEPQVLYLLGILPACDERLLPYFVREESWEFNRANMQRECEVSYTLRFPERTRLKLADDNICQVVVDSNVLEWLARHEADVPEEIRKPVQSKVTSGMPTLVRDYAHGTATYGQKFIVLSREVL